MKKSLEKIGEITIAANDYNTDELQKIINKFGYAYPDYDIKIDYEEKLGQITIDNYAGPTGWDIRENVLDFLKNVDLCD